VSHWNACVHENVIERERAAKREGHEIAAPERHQVRDLRDLDSVFEHQIPWDVDSHVDVPPERR
jgi:hypothetical protein